MKEELRLGELGGAVIDAAAQDLADYRLFWEFRGILNGRLERCGDAGHRAL